MTVGNALAPIRRHERPNTKEPRRGGALAEIGAKPVDRMEHQRTLIVSAD